jgi:hypothetical protein
VLPLTRFHQRRRLPIKSYNSRPQRGKAPKGDTRYLILQGANDQAAPPENGELLKAEQGRARFHLDSQQGRNLDRLSPIGMAIEFFYLFCATNREAEAAERGWRVFTSLNETDGEILGVCSREWLGQIEDRGV